MSKITTVVDNIITKVNEHTTVANNHINLSGITAYHLLQGNLAVSDSTITQGFSTTLYTGNGATQSINTGVDMNTQWGNDASEQFGGLVWLKSRGVANWHHLHDTIRGATKSVQSSTTNAEGTYNTLTSFLSNGFSVGIDAGGNTNNDNMVSWNFQTTHRRTGVTNHGKAYTEHYNPFTGFTIIKYEGSGTAGHEIPHSLERKLGFWNIKDITSASYNWATGYREGNQLKINLVDAEAVLTTGVVALLDNVIVLGNSIAYNTSSNQHIMYGWANSYLDESNKLIGNYELVPYQGTGVAGNKVKTKGKPAWVMIKRIDSTGTWIIFDNTRGMTIGNDNYLYANASSAENIGGAADLIEVKSDGFIINSATVDVGASGGQYIALVAYDTNSNGGGSYYPLASDTANVQVNNALIPLAQGIDSNGAKNTILSKNETITGLAYTQGKNYVYCDKNGSYGRMSIAPNYGKVNPANGGDFYNVLTNKWFTSAGVEITNSRNYLNHIVYADADGGVLYVEELPKIEYKDIVKANEFKGKNACTAWVNFDGTTTPPTIRDSYNVSAIIRTATGYYDIYFKEEMDSLNYCIIVSSAVGSGGRDASGILSKYINKVSIQCIGGDGVAYNSSNANIQIFGGKN